MVDSEGYLKVYLASSNRWVNLSNDVLDIFTPLWCDLGMLPTIDYSTSSSAFTYVVVKQLLQAITCMSSLNVSGYIILKYNVTCMSNLHVHGNLYSNTTSLLKDNLNS